ncbi:MAG: hypothetical protein LHW56_01280 [Candidatus Cloacimonetes bacterium]|nr:hypothetical protein [Candidatus Cloacimonadota bacterium]MDY0171518.1 hypothetical protein [Candidatus Cloacimonadaceae bacterium]
MATKECKLSCDRRGVGPNARNHDDVHIPQIHDVLNNAHHLGLLPKAPTIQMRTGNHWGVMPNAPTKNLCTPESTKIMFDPQIHHRKSIRLKGFNYSLEEGYFITICSHEKKCLFGRVEQGEMRLNEFGETVESEWLKSAIIRKEIVLDEYVVMPNHFHAIVFFRRDVGYDAQNQQIGPNSQNIYEDPAAQPEGSGFSPQTPTLGLKKKSLGSLMAGFKTGVTSQVRKLGYQGDLWQRNYYEHVIRNEEDFYSIKDYIMHNPANWAKDTINPDYE